MRNNDCGSGILKFENFKFLLDNNPAIRQVELSNWGEVFLNKDLSRILEYAHTARVKVTISNGANLNHASEKALEALVRTQVEEVVVALDGATDETYQKYRVRGRIDRVLNNIDTINAFKRKYDSQKPRLVWQYILFGHNEHEIGAARLLSKNLDMTFAPKLNALPDYSPVVNVEEVMAETGLQAGRVQPDWGTAICNQLWRSPQINWDGKILGCCHNTWQDFGGNAFADTLDECLNSVRLVYARKMVAGKVPQREDIPCTRCEFYACMSRTDRWVNFRRVSTLSYVEKRFPHLHLAFKQARRRYTAARVLLLRTLLSYAQKMKAYVRTT